MPTAHKPARGLLTPVHLSIRLGDAIGVAAAVLLLAVVAGYALGASSGGSVDVVVPSSDPADLRTWSTVLVLVGTFVFALAALWRAHAAWAKVKTAAVVGWTLAGAGLTGLLVPLAL